MKSYGVTIQMKATEQYFPVVLFIMLYKVVLIFEFVDEMNAFWQFLHLVLLVFRHFPKMKFLKLC